MPNPAVEDYKAIPGESIRVASARATRTLVVLSAVACGASAFLNSPVGYAVGLIGAMLVSLVYAGSVLPVAIALISYLGAVAPSHYDIGEPTQIDQVDVSIQLGTLVALSIVLFAEALRRSPTSAAAGALVASGVVLTASPGVGQGRVIVAALATAVIVLIVSAVARASQPDRRNLARSTLQSTSYLLLLSLLLEIVRRPASGFGGRGLSSTGAERWVGVTIEPNELAELAILAIVLAGALRSRREVSPVHFIAIVGVGTVLLVAAESRTALVLAVLWLLFLIVLYNPLFGTAIVGSALLLALVVTTIGSPTFAALSRVDSAEEVRTLNGRTLIWSESVGRRADDPLGAGGYGAAESEFAASYDNGGSLPWRNISDHNRFLEAWSSSGPIGAGTILFAWLSILWLGRRSRHAIAICAVSLASSMMLPVFGGLRLGLWIVVPLVVVGSDLRPSSRLSQ